MKVKVKVKSIAHDQIYSESKHLEITIGKEYLVLAIQSDSFRILSDENEPILYEKEIFDIIDDHIPENWVREDYEDDEYFIHPPEFLNPPYFFEEYFDGHQQVIDIFNAYIQKQDMT